MSRWSCANLSGGRPSPHGDAEADRPGTTLSWAREADALYGLTIQARIPGRQVTPKLPTCVPVPVTSIRGVDLAGSVDQSRSKTPFEAPDLCRRMAEIRAPMG